MTPNHLHADAAIKCLDAGLHVICDKPLSTTPAQAARIAQAVKNSAAQFFLTHNYTGYPMVRLARDMVARGELGALRLIVVNYVQGWLENPIETEGHKQAKWRSKLAHPAEAYFLNTHRHRPIPYRGNGSFHRVSGGHQAPRVVRPLAICRTHATMGVVTKGRVKRRLRPFLRSPHNGLIRPNSYRPAMCLLHRPADSVDVSGRAHCE